MAAKTKTSEQLMRDYQRCMSKLMEGKVLHHDDRQAYLYTLQASHDELMRRAKQLRISDPPARTQRKRDGLVP